MKTFLFTFLFFLTASSWARSPVEESSYYDLSISLTDQDGKKVSFNTFKGHPVVISMFYGSCDFSCPVLIDALQKMDASLNAGVRAQTRILLISFDPENDTPENLKKLAVKHQLDLTRWKLAAPKPDQVRDIAALLNFNYRPLPTGGFNHTSSLTLLDALGIPLLQEEGLSNAAQSVAEKLNKTFGKESL